FALFIASTCLRNVRQLVKPWHRATKNCAPVRVQRATDSFDFRFLCHTRSIRSMSPCISLCASGVIACPCRRARVSAQRAAHSRIAPGSTDLQAYCRSLASFLYCSRLGRGGKGRASDIRISFHHVPGVRTGQAERRFVTFKLSSWGG